MCNKFMRLWQFCSLVLWVAVLFGVSVAPTQAATFTVGNATELIAAINTANANGVADVITLTGNIDMNCLMAVFTVDGNNVLPSITSDIAIIGNGFTIARISTRMCRIFHVAGGGNLTLNNVTLSNGYAFESGPVTLPGGGIYNRGTVTIINSTLSNNIGFRGGGVYNDNGTVTITNSTLSNNITIRGGGVYNNDGTVTIINSTISDNLADGGGFVQGIGGGVFNAGTMTISNSTITNNSAQTESGGVANRGTMMIRNSTISVNSADTLGGGITNSNGTLTVINSTISDNSAPLSGAIFNNDDDTMTISNSTISVNSANIDGGITNIGTMTISNSTISGNSATVSRSGIFNNIGTITIRNSIVVGNTGGDECFLASGTFNTNANNLLGVDGSASLGCPVGLTDIIASGSITTVLNTTLANNGGLAQTHALVAGSPAIDASGASATTTDQRGVPVQGVRRDIGAFEFGVTPTYPTVQFASTGTTFTETAGTVNLTLNVTGAAHFAGIAEVYIIDMVTGTATSGADYTAFPMTTVTIDCSSGTCPATRTVSLALLTDTVLEANETVILRIIGANGFATIGAQNTFTATIQDATTSTASISATTATATFDPLANGQFTVDLGAVNQTGAPITVNYSVAGTAVAGTDYTTLAGSVSIANGQQTAAIDVVPLLTSLTDKTVEVTLTGTSNASVGVSATPATVTVEGGGSATIALNVATDTVLENGGNQTAQVIYTGTPLQAGQQVDFTVTRADITTSPADFDGTPLVTNGSFVAGGATTIHIDTAIFDDDIVETNEQYTLTLGGLATTPAGLAVTIGAISVQTVTITDNETPNVHVNPVSLLVLTGDASVYTVVLTAEPFADVTVTITPNNANCTTSLANLTFTPTNWNTPQNVVVAVAGVVGSVCAIAHTATGGGYDAVAIPDVDVLIIAVPLANNVPASGGVSTPQLTLSGLGVAGTQGQGIPRPNENAVWQFSIFNNTGAPVNDVTALVTFPDDDMEGVRASSNTGINGAFSKGSLLVDFNLGTIGAGETTTLTIVTRLPNRAAIFAGTLSVRVGGVPLANSATLTLLTVNRLPATGETPAWAIKLRQWLGLE